MRLPSVLQNKAWTTQRGETLALEDMTREHRRNLLAYLRRRIDQIRHELLWYWALEVHGHEGGELAHEALECELEFVTRASDDELFDSLPLIKRLRSLQEEAGRAWEPSGTPPSPGWEGINASLDRLAQKVRSASVQRDPLPGYHLDEHSDEL